MTAKEVVSFQAAQGILPKVQVDHQTCEDEPEEDIGGDDVPLVVVFQALR